MNPIFNTLLHHINDENSVFVFTTEIACTSWQDKILEDEIVQAIPLEKFIAWDKFKSEAVRSKVQNKTSIPSVVRKLFSHWVIEENKIAFSNNSPLFSSIINPEYINTSSSFANWITNLLPQLQNWKEKFERKSIFDETVDLEAKDLFTLYNLYSSFLDKHSLFEPAWEKPPFDSNNKHYYIFYPELLEDYSEYESLLLDAEKENLVTLIHCKKDLEIIPQVNYFSNTRTELRKAILLINKLHNEEKIPYEKIALHIPQISEIRPYIKRELELYNIPYKMRAGKKLSEYPEGRLFELMKNCVSEKFSFESLSSLFSDAHFPWKVTTEINQLLEFALKNHCVCSYDNKDILEQNFLQNPQETRAFEFYKSAKKILKKINESKTFLQVRNSYFEFRETFFETKNFTLQANQILGRCISELSVLIDIENSFNDIECKNPFTFFTEILDSKEYLAQSTTNGVSIFPYKVGCQCSFDYHIILQSSQKNLSINYSQLEFLSKTKREFLELKDSNVSDYFINSYTSSSVKQTYFFASQKTFSGYSLSYSGLEEIDRTTETSDEEDLYNTEKLFLTNNPKTKNLTFSDELHSIQKDGFENWILTREEKSSEYEENICDKISFAIKNKLCNSEGKLRVSATNLNDFYKNPTKWLYDKILKIEKNSTEASIVDNVFIGIIYHEIIKRLFTMIKTTTEYFLNTEEAIKEYLNFTFNEVEAVVNNFPESTNTTQNISLLTKEFLLTQKKSIYQNLANFLQGFLNFFTGYKIKSLEEKFLMKGETEEYYLEGIIDCILISPEDKITIIDFKTYKTPEKKTDLQIPLYIKLYENYLKENNINTQVEQACFFSILQSKPNVVLGTLKNQSTNKITPNVKADRIYRNQVDCLDGEKCLDDTLQDLDEKIKFFVSSVLSGKNFLLSEENVNKILFCSFDNIMEEEFIF